MYVKRKKNIDICKIGRTEREPLETRSKKKKIRIYCKAGKEETKKKKKTPNEKVH